MQIRIGQRLIGDYLPPFVVAEIGQNHNGDSYHAIRLVAMAVKAGADAVKFQLRECEQEFAPEVLDAPHPEPWQAYGDTYREHRRAVDLPAADLKMIKERILYNTWSIEMYATPCHISCVEPLESMDCPAFKIASKDLGDLALINECASTGKPVILSTGMAGIYDLAAAVETVQGHHNDLIVLQCVSAYPCLSMHLNLPAIAKIRKAFGCLVGLSDHTIGIGPPAWAVQHGACMIEKHITLARAQKGTDHAMSLEPDGLARVVRDVRLSWKACQSDEWETASEILQPIREKLGA